VVVANWTATGSTVIIAPYTAPLLTRIRFVSSVGYPGLIRDVVPAPSATTQADFDWS